MHSRARALSSVTAFTPSLQILPPYHPALSIIDYIDVLGPLVFPLHRVALLRKRILMIGSAPVRKACEHGMRTRESVLKNQPLTAFYDTSLQFIHPL